jgi:hypothetical protein
MHSESRGRGRGASGRVKERTDAASTTPGTERLRRRRCSVPIGRRSSVQCGFPRRNHSRLRSRPPSRQAERLSHRASKPVILRGTGASACLSVSPRLPPRTAGDGALKRLIWLDVRVADKSSNWIACGLPASQRKRGGLRSERCPRGGLRPRRPSPASIKKIFPAHNSRATVSPNPTQPSKTALY